MGFSIRLVSRQPMNQDGKNLENLVRQIEVLLLPKGFSVHGNNRVYNDDGVQIAEFDIEIRGRLGSTDIVWLIECRDRPGQGPAPGSWIEQLVGRRDRFGFDKVTAVSTTGFAQGAVDYAGEAGIELRTVTAITAQDVAGWLALSHIGLKVRCGSLNATKLLVESAEATDRKEALQRAIRGVSGDVRILRSIKTGDVVSAAVAFQRAVETVTGIFADVEANGPSKPVRLRASYPEKNDHFVVDTDNGAVCITAILFEGELSIREMEIPISSIIEYSRNGTKERIAQTVMFPVEMLGAAFSLELHNLADTGETHVLLRKVDG